MKRFIFQAYVFLAVLLSGFLSSKVTSLIFKSNYSAKNMLSGLMNGKPDMLIYFIGILLGFFLLFSICAFLLVKKFNFVQGKEKLATSDFAKVNEFEGFTGNDGLLIGKKFRLSEKKSFEHFCLIGPTGSGKSASFFIPNLLELPPSASVVVSDPKGELFEKTAAHALRQGKRVLVFSPFKKSTMKYNPLELCRSISEIRELAQILLANGNAAVEAITGTKAGGSEWTNMSTPLLAAFLIYVKDLDAPENTITNALTIIVENDLETLKFLMMDAHKEAKKQFNIFLQSAESEQTASSIKTVLASNLQMFLDPMVEEVTNFNDINPKMLREHPTHLYVVVPEHKSAFMSPLMAPFYTQLMGHLIEDGSGCPVHFLLDEFANIGLIPNIDVIAATCRSRSMSLSLGIQSVNQLKQRYNDASESLLDNLKTKAVLPGLSYNSAKYISDMLGHKEISTTSTSFGKKQDSSFSVSAQKRELLAPDEIRRLPDETVLIISDNRNPFIDKQIRYYKNERMLKLTQQPIDLDEYIKKLKKELSKPKR